LQVILAQPRGFCAGVVRAIEIVERALDLHKAPVYVRHEIVHNRHVVEDLKSKGARFVEELSEVPDGAMTVFSAHGVPRSVIDEASRRGLPVLDATCPLVSKVHNQGRRYVGDARTLILVGHAGHPEVEGTMGQVGGPTYLVSSEADVEALDIPEDTRVAYVTQTTLSIDDTKSVIAAVKRKFSDVVGPDTSDICYATQNRQNAIRDLAAKSDLILVVGARNSSNSNRLRELSEECGVTSHLLNDATELDLAWLDGIATVGITAGASAPEELVAGLVDKLAESREVIVSQMAGIEENVSFSLPKGLRGETMRQAADSLGTNA